MEKIKSKLVTISRAEGPSRLCGKTLCFGSLSAATREIKFWNETYPGPGEGYDKHDFSVIFQDGEIYNGRLDVKKQECPDNDQDVGKHIESFMSFLAGVMKPYHMSFEQYKEYLQRNGGESSMAEAKSFLERYDLSS